MALSSVPLAFARGIVLASGTSVVAVNGTPAAFPVPDNCTTILVTNPNAAAIVGLVGIATAPAALTAGVNAQRIPPGTTLTLSIGTIANRGSMDPAAVTGGGLVYDSIGGAVTLEITYICQIGSP